MSLSERIDLDPHTVGDAFFSAVREQFADEEIVARLDALLWATACSGAPWVATGRPEQRRTRRRFRCFGIGARTVYGGIHCRHSGGETPARVESQI